MKTLVLFITKKHLTPEEKSMELMHAAWGQV